MTPTSFLRNYVGGRVRDKLVDLVPGLVVGVVLEHAVFPHVVEEHFGVSDLGELQRERDQLLRGTTARDDVELFGVECGRFEHVIDLVEPPVAGGREVSLLPVVFAHEDVNFGFVDAERRRQVVQDALDAGTEEHDDCVHGASWGVCPLMRGFALGLLLSESSDDVNGEKCTWGDNLL